MLMYSTTGGKIAGIREDMGILLPPTHVRSMDVDEQAR